MSRLVHRVLRLALAGVVVLVAVVAAANAVVLLRTDGAIRTEPSDLRPAQVVVVPGLVPGIHVLHCGRVKGGWVYIMTNKPDGTLYLGVTADLSRRVYEHRQGTYPGFTRKYGLKRLVWYEQHDDFRPAIQREKTMKHWSRAWKVRMIMAANPDWRDLYEDLA